MNILNTLYPLPNMSKRVLPVLPTLSQEDVSTIWELVSDFVQEQLSLSKGVQIPGLGIFTFSRQQLEIGNNKFMVVKRPLFFLSEKLVQKHGLKQNKIYVAGDIPVVPLTFVKITLQSPFNKDIVEGCIKETLQLLSRSLSMQKHIKFTFKGIGILTIKDDKVKMKFFKEFLYGMDDSGSLVKTLVNRPYTMDSVVSISETSNVRPISVLSFPRADLKEDEKKLPMETITEKDEQSRLSTAVKKKSDNNGVRAMVSQKEAEEKVTSTANSITSSKLEQKESEAKEVNKQRDTSPDYLKEKKPESSKLLSCQNHNKAGQELCYVCLQREQRNIPRSDREEKRKQEIKEESFLHQCQMLTEKKSLLRQKVKCLATREQNQKNAAFNLGVADAIRIHRNTKQEFSNMFLFDKRPESTDVNIAKQKNYTQSLLQQIKTKHEKLMKEKQNQELIDALEKEWNREEAIAEREKYLKDKNKERVSFKRELDLQIKNYKPFRLPASVPDSIEPIFGKQDDHALLLSHQKDLECRKDQLERAASKQRRRIIEGLKNQQQDIQTLKNIRKEFLEESLADADRMKSINEELLDHWGKCAQEKRQRDKEEKAFVSSSDNIFILDQCDKYERCKQCKRSICNNGKTNMWPINKFMTGSRVYM